MYEFPRISVHSTTVSKTLTMQCGLQNNLSVIGSLVYTVVYKWCGGGGWREATEPVIPALWRHLTFNIVNPMRLIHQN